MVSQRARGVSIGINVNPDKYCNFKCVYCEVDRDHASPDITVDLDVMSAELKGALERVVGNRLGELPEFSGLPSELLTLKEIALSGDGEPTLSPQFESVLHDVLCVRARGTMPFFKIVIITNTAGLTLPGIRQALRLLNRADEVWVKLDAGTQEYMNRVNGPDITIDAVTENILSIARERPVVVQSLFSSIGGEEPSEGEIAKYVERLKDLKDRGAQISLVQIYSAHRPPHLAECKHLPLKTLMAIAKQVRSVCGLKAEVF